MSREWKYWTRNKLAILADYLPAFNAASVKSPHRVYLDLMAGEPMNVDKDTGETIDGSARVAMAASPAFTRLVFCERDIRRARALEADLRDRFPGDERWTVVTGDCNADIEKVLAPIIDVCWAPIFVFIDQQAAEVTWATIEAVARVRKRNGMKSELWILMSPAMIVKGSAGTNADLFRVRVDGLYGSTNWRRVLLAREHNTIDAEGFRTEMVNLFRWQLQTVLGYKQTVRIPMNMANGTAIYDMVFATDHPVGEKIMTSVYRKAAQREPDLMAESLASARTRREEQGGVLSLFDLTPELVVNGGASRWENTACWNPTDRDWWEPLDR